MVQHATCRNSSLVFEYGTDTLRMRGEIDGEPVTLDFSDGPLGRLLRDRQVRALPLIGCTSHGFELDVDGVKVNDQGAIAEAGDSMIYEHGAPIEYLSEQRPFKTVTDADGTVKMEISSLDPRPPSAFQTEISAQCTGGRYTLRIDHRSKRAFMSSEATQRYGIELTDSKIGQLLFRKRGRMDLVCNAALGAILEFSGATNLAARDEDDTKLVPINARATVDANASLVTDADVVL